MARLLQGPLLQVSNTTHALAVNGFREKFSLSLRVPWFVMAAWQWSYLSANAELAVLSKSLPYFSLCCAAGLRRKCVATGKLLAWDPSVQYPVPPILRPFK